MNLKQISIASIVIAIIVLGGMYGYLSTQDNEERLFIATTTSVDNTGLLQLLITEFSNIYDINVSVSAVGSGTAIEYGRNGDVDALLVHAPDLEQELVDSGYAINHTTLWYNYFIIAGPVNDPANISHATSAQDAFDRIRETRSPFYSRGDNSGTHLKEISIWDTVPNASIETDWYFETGSGMGATLLMANEQNGYVLTDHGTFTSYKADDTIPNLISHYNEDDSLYNPYSYMIISPMKYPDLNTENAKLFLEFLQSDKALAIVRGLKIGDTLLFTPVGE
ncbi:MAG: substrate-binding domain-containing protein [Candidatus Heimdallarchaeota archaeon]|nr:substrate-binding domain-containing protein [Candidatus Heimdallarchaeota archaeon]